MRQGGYLQELNQDARSTEHKIVEERDYLLRKCTHYRVLLTLTYTSYILLLTL